jgi:hypothetical protein
MDHVLFDGRHFHVPYASGTRGAVALHLGCDARWRRRSHERLFLFLLLPAVIILTSVPKRIQMRPDLFHGAKVGLHLERAAFEASAAETGVTRSVIVDFKNRMCKSSKIPRG